MALSFLKDRDENAVVGNLGAFTGGGARGNSIQTALEIYRKDQKTHHEQSIASDLTRGLLRKVFRDTVLESSKQVKRKYSYSAVGSTVQEDIDAANMGIMAKLKKLQKERLIVARLGFPDKAMEIDEHIEKIRADLRSEREKVDSRILEDALAALAVRHNERLSALELKLKADENKVEGAFERERAVLLGKQEKQFVRLVDDAIKRAIGKSKSCSCEKKYLCHHNKTASFNTRRPKKEVIHFRKNAKRLRHGGRLDESAAWEEKAAELDADHLDRWREEVAASLTASAWGGSSSALDQLASQHQREITRMETAQANEWTLMLLRHRTARRNCHNAIMVEQKKLRNACKKNAEERHRREMVGDPDQMDGKEVPLGDPDEEDISGMLRDAIDDENSADGGEEQAGIADSCGGGAAANRPPVRPTSAPPARGRRPQPSNSSGNQQASAAGIVLAAGGVRRGEEGGGVAAGAGVSEDDDSFGKDSHDLRGFDELEGETAAAFSYEDYPAAGSPEEPEWIHDPWCGTNSGDIPVVDKNEVLGGGGGGNPGEKEVPASSPVASPTSSAERVDAEVVETAVGVGEDRGDLTAIVSPLSSVTDGGEGPYDGRDVCGKGTPPRVSRRASAPRTVAGGKELKRYDWGGADAVPTKPALLAASRIPTGNRADKQRHRNAKKKDANRKSVSWGENLEVPPESDDDDADGDDNGDNGHTEKGGGGENALDDIADGFVDDDFLGADDESGDQSIHRNPTSSIDARQEHDRLDQSGESRDSNAGGAALASDAGDTDKGWMLAKTDGEEEMEDVEGIYSDQDDGSVVRVDADERTDKGGGIIGSVVDIVPARERVESSPAEDELVSHEESESEQDGGEEEHPLQRALDQFCLIGTLHGDWLCLLGQIAGHTACRNALCRWSRPYPWGADVETCLSSGMAADDDKRIRPWDAARAQGAAAAVACSSTLAPFVASSSARCLLRNRRDARKALGGRSCEREPALARSKRPWRTLFERVLGSLQYGAVLCLADTSAPRRELNDDGQVVSARRDSPSQTQTTSTDVAAAAAAAAAAGKVVWANEGFEKLAGVDAVDVVGQDIRALFEEGGAGEEGGGELKRSLELGTSCMLWMTMTGHEDELTDVLCLHQPVEVPPRLSDEGRYSALLFFDSASVSISDTVPNVGVVEGGQARESENRSSASPPDGVVVFDPGGNNQDRECSRRQACRDLSKAMAILLADHEGHGIAPAGSAGLVAGTFDVSGSTGATGEAAPVINGRGELETNTGDEGFAAPTEGGGGPKDIPDEEQRYVLTSRLPSTSSPPSQPPLLLSRDSDVVSGDEDGRSRAGRGSTDEKPHRGNRPGEVSLSKGTLHSDDGGRNRDEDGHDRTGRGGTQHQQQEPRPHNPVANAANISIAVEYLSSDEGSAEPRDDLLLSPDSTGATAVASTTSERPLVSDARDRHIAHRTSSSNVDYRGCITDGRSHSVDGQLLAAKDSPPTAGDSRPLLENTRSSYEGGGTGLAAAQQDGSDDPYEDDFCCDEEDDSLSLSAARAGEDGFGVSKSEDSNNSYPESRTRGNDLVVGAAHGTEVDVGNDAFALSSSGRTYSGTVANEINHGNDEASWRESPEEGLREGDVWGIHSPPQLKSRDVRGRMLDVDMHKDNYFVTDVATESSGVLFAANERG